MLSTLILTLLKTTAIQLAGLFGIFFAFGIVLSWLQRVTQYNYRRALGWRGILFTAWFGTPFHELGHVFFAKLFRHRVTKVSLFSPNESTGGLGSVDHSYNKNSLYQKIGNFFVGSAPIIFGGAVLSLMLYFLIPNGKSALTPLLQADSVEFYFFAIQRMFLTLFSIENLTKWNFWLFIYLSFCIVAHLAPSKEDRRGMWAGLGWIILILLCVNFVTLLVQFDITKYILRSAIYLQFLVGVFVYATAIAIVHFFLSFILLRPFSRR